MIIAFTTEELRAICEVELRAQRAFGVIAAEALLSLLADLLAADNLQDLPPDLLQDADGEGGRYEVLLPDGFVVRLSVRQYAAHRTESGEIDRARVRRVMIHAVDKCEVGRG